MTENWSFLSTLAQVISTAALASSAFFFSGYLYYLGFFHVFGIPMDFINYRFDEFVLRGVNENFILFFALMMIIVKFYAISFLRAEKVRHAAKLKWVLEVEEKDFVPTTDDEMRRHIPFLKHELTGAIERLEKRIRGMTEVWGSKRELLFFVCFIAAVIAAAVIIKYYIRGSLGGLPSREVWLLLFTLFAQTFLVFLLYWRGSFLVKENPIHRFVALSIFPFVIVLFLCLPYANGYFSAKRDMSADTNDISINVDEGVAIEGMYVYSDEERYILLVDGKTKVIPSAAVTSVNLRNSLD